MSQPTPIERDQDASSWAGNHCDPPGGVGGACAADPVAQWLDRGSNAATVKGFSDPEGNGPGHLDHNL